MIELALATVLAALTVLLWSQRKQQQAISHLFQMQPTVTRMPPPNPQPRALSENEKRILTLVDDSETIYRQILTAKCYSRSHSVKVLGFSQYRWNRSMALLRELDIFDGQELLCSYSESRTRLRRHFQNQVALARRSERFVSSV